MKLIVGSVVLSALIAGSAWAADMPAKAPLYRAPYSWTGCYAGVNAGLLWGLNRYDNSPSGAFVALGPAGIAAGQTSYSPGGSNGQAYTYGGQIGCNYQWGAVVGGVEADFNGTGLDESILVTFPANAFFLGRNETVSQRIGWLSTTRGRLGVTPLEGWLFYATGGLAVANLRGLYQSLFTDGTTFSGSATTTRTGYAAGGGVEWGAAPSWTVKFEYLYVDLGSWSFVSPNTSAAGGPPAPGFTWTTNIRAHEQIFRLGVNYRFGGPIIASY